MESSNLAKQIKDNGMDMCQPILPADVNGLSMKSSFNTAGSAPAALAGMEQILNPAGPKIELPVQAQTTNNVLNSIEAPGSLPESVPAIKPNEGGLETATRHLSNAASELTQSLFGAVTDHSPKPDSSPEIKQPAPQPLMAMNYRPSPGMGSGMNG